MFRYKKLCSTICLAFYMLVSTNCAQWIIYQTGEVAFGIIYDDYACKGGDCGCNSAFKCLTDCCCERINQKGQVIAACKAVKTESCCSEKNDPPEENCCSEKNQPSQSGPAVKSAGCSKDLAQSIIDKCNLHLVILPEDSNELNNHLNFNWNSSSLLYSPIFKSKIPKIPIS